MAEVWKLVLDPRRIKKSIIPPSYFLIDGDDWLKHILNNNEFHYRDSIDITLLDTKVSQLYEELSIMGIQPIIFLSKQSRNHRNLQNIPATQFKKTLKKLSVGIEESEVIKRSENMLEFWKHMLSTADYSCYIYGSAAIDLWAVKGVSYILFDSLKISDSGDKVQAPVWNRALVAEILFTSEKQLIELLILVGNKFTKGYGRKKYRSATGGGAPHRFFDQENNHTSDNMVSLAAMRDWILLQGVPFKLETVKNRTSSLEKAEKENVNSIFDCMDQAIEYSREFYDNKDVLNRFFTDKNNSRKQSTGANILSKSTRETNTSAATTNAAAAIMAAISGSLTKKLTISDDNKQSDLKSENKANEQGKNKRNQAKDTNQKDLSNNKEEKTKKDSKDQKEVKKDTRSREKDIARNSSAKSTAATSTSIPIVSSPTSIDISTADTVGGDRLRNMLGMRFALASAKASAQFVGGKAAGSPDSNSTIAIPSSFNDKNKEDSVDGINNIIFHTLESNEVTLQQAMLQRRKIRDAAELAAATATANTTIPVPKPAVVNIIASPPPGLSKENLIKFNKVFNSGIDTASSDVQPVAVEKTSIHVQEASSSTLISTALVVLPTNTSTAAPAMISSSPLSGRSLSKGITVLPIDAHKEKIISHIAAHSVTIIHGMTGCGKSSRLPAMLLEQGESEGNPTMILVSQPRRIAARALKNRLYETLGDKVGLRLGSGVKEETSNTKLWFVTSGYLVALLAHQMKAFEKYTHLIIDEVHERSVDSDILCLLAKKMLEIYPHTKIILMSATVHDTLYRTYFNIEEETIFVGVKRFAQQFYYCEDMFSMLPGSCHASLSKLIDSTSGCQGYQGEAVLEQTVKEQLIVAVALTKYIISDYNFNHYSSILIFVSGMADINELIEKFELVKKNCKLKLKIVPIHSDIPMDEQLLAFETASKGEAKVIIATNAAESSLTLPDCDHVICLGTHKMLSYNDRHNASQLMNCWISKASATQRAGRTGRMRPGTVYRLYPSSLYSKLAEHNISEIHRQPLSEVILRLRVMLDNAPTQDQKLVATPKNKNTTDFFPPMKVALKESITVCKTERSNSESSLEMGTETAVVDVDDMSVSEGAVEVRSVTAFLNQGVVPVLMSLLEPPSMEHVRRSLQFLFDVGMLTSPDDKGELTDTGKLAGQLPVDLMLGRFISLGVLMGLSEEVVIMAASLSLPKSPFRAASNIVHTDPDEYNKIVRDGFFARSRLDRGHLSEPLMLLSALNEWRACGSEKEKFAWCQRNCIAHARMRSLDSTARNLNSRLSTGLSELKKGRRKGEEKGSDMDSLVEGVAPTIRTANMLRLILIWSFHNNLIRLQTPASENALCVAHLPVTNISINANMISSIFKDYNGKETYDKNKVGHTESIDMREKNREDYDYIPRPTPPSILPTASLSLVPSAAAPSLPPTIVTSSSWDDLEIITDIAPAVLLSLDPLPPAPVTPTCPVIEVKISRMVVKTVTGGTLTKNIPPEIQWRLMAEGRRIYTAMYADRSFEALLSSFTSCVQEMHVPVAWLHSKQSVPEKTIIIMIDKLSFRILEFLRTVYPGNLELLGSYGGMTVASTENKSNSNSDKQLGRLEELYNENISSLSWTLPDNRNMPYVSNDSHGRSGSSNIYSNNNSSGSNIYNKNVVKQPSTAVLVCANCMPTDLQIRSLFLGDTSVSTSSSTLNDSWRVISTKVIKSKMQIEFLPDSPSAYSNGGSDILNVGKQQNGNKLFSSPQSIPRWEIIRNVPLGKCLLNSMRLGSSGERSSVRLRGIGEGFENTRREGKEIMIKVQTQEPSWVANRLGNVGVIGTLVEELLDTSGKQKRVVLPNYSLQQVAQHIGQETVYAVSYTLTLLGDDAVRAEGVSLLPGGKKWTALALESMGVSSLGLKLRSDEEPTTEEMSQAVALNNLLSSSGASSSAIHKIVDKLFAPWLKPSPWSNSNSKLDSSIENGNSLLSQQQYEESISGDLNSIGLLTMPCGSTSDLTLSAVGMEVDESELSTAAWLFRDVKEADADKPIKAKKLINEPVIEIDPSAGWKTLSKTTK